MPAACTLREHRVAGMRAVTLANEFLSVTTLPEKGGDICSFVSRKRKVDVLWRSPWGLRPPGSAIATAANSEAAWLEQYEGGWQEIFPNGGDACAYRGATLSFHGEASVSAWDCSVVRRSAAAVSIELTVELRRSPFRLRRRMTVERSLAALLLEETVENRGEEDLHFMWGHHPAFGKPFLGGGCRLQVPARTFQAHDTEISPACRIAAGARGGWPVLPGKSGEPVDLSLIPPSDQRVTEFGYLLDFDEGWYGIVNEDLHLGFGLAWPKSVFPYAWFWQELRGSFGYPWYGRCYVMAVEPFTSIPGTGLVNAIAHGAAPVLKAGAKIEAHLAAVLFEPAEVRSITTEGKVRAVIG